MKANLARQNGVTLHTTNGPDIYSHNNHKNKPLTKLKLSGGRESKYMISHKTQKAQRTTQQSDTVRESFYDIQRSAASEVRKTKQGGEKNNNKSVANLSISHHHYHHHHHSPQGRRVQKRQLQNLKFTYTKKQNRNTERGWLNGGSGYPRL